MEDDLKLAFTPKIITLNFQSAFEHLTKNEKLLAYYLQRSCWDGAPIMLFQNSYESPAIFIILQNFFSSFSPFDQLKKTIFENGK
jgi:hypothetical protein